MKINNYTYSINNRHLDMNEPSLIKGFRIIVICNYLITHNIHCQYIIINLYYITIITNMVEVEMGCLSVDFFPQQFHWLVEEQFDLEH